ncbi:MAG TPA: hypothetical protein VKQ29_06125 [Aliidongia sp.]|nr:hypothetical protein [Aliidongia sp.]
METTSAPGIETITVQGQAPTAKSHLWAGDHFSFHDLLDAINPLQHIPIVGTIYREITGDTLGNAARVVGDGLYGGVIGVIAGLVDVSVLETTGKDIGGNVLAALGVDEGDKSANTPDAPAAAGEPASPPASSAPAQAPAATPAPAPAPADLVAQAAPAPAVPSGIPLAAAPPQPIPMPLSTAPKLMALNDSQAHGFPIDTSPEGILALRTTANNAPKPVPLNIPAGTLAPNRRIPVTGAEFVQRMQEGLDKYKAMMIARGSADAGSSVDQVQ